MELREVAPKVYACLQEDRGWCYNNRYISRSLS